MLPPEQPEVGLAGARWLVGRDVAAVGADNGGIMVAPLLVPGAAGSPVTPLAVG